ncbi:MAG: hypothetical protein GC159_22335 [Phycisphaera sp.]|nr:hypothetical protein [Phycisphaera sp.]
MCLVIFIGGNVARAAQPQDDGPAYPVSQILLDFGADLPIHPPTKQLTGLEINLGMSDGEFTAPKEGQPVKTIKIVDIPSLHARFHASAIKAIGDRLVAHFNEWGYTGIVAQPHVEEIDKTGKDVRPAGQTALRLVIMTDGTWAGVPGRPDETVSSKPYEVRQFVISFDPNVPKRPPVAEVFKYEIDLGEVLEGYVGPRPGGKTVKIRLGDVPKLPKSNFYPSAIQTICRRLALHLEERGFTGLEVVAHPQDIDEEGNDVRFANQTALRLVVRVAPPKVEPAELPADGVAVAEPEPIVLAEPTEADGARYSVSQIIIEYAEEHPAHPPLREVMEVAEVQLSETEDGFVDATASADSRTVRLVDVPLLDKHYLYGSAIREISTAIVEDYARRGYIGINVMPHPEDIDMQARDVRPEGQTALRMLVRVGTVGEIRLVKNGAPVDEDHPMASRVLDNSPVQPGDFADPQRQDLLRKDALDSYISRLNRHPGRRVEVAVSPGKEAGSVALDFLVTESKPWMVYAQISNTGTDETSEWRERFGFVHHQLTKNDDTLSIDYSTANFDEVHAINASYEAPLMDIEPARWRVFSSFSHFTSSDVGFASEAFTGRDWALGGDIIYNVYQWQQLFVDVVGGVKYQDIKTKNKILNTEGDAGFFLPHLGVQMERYTEKMNTYASIDFEAGIGGDQKDNSEGLGRLAADDDFFRMTFDASHSFYLEPLLFPSEWADTTTPKSSTLAHELYFGLSGQYGFDYRFNPQFERTIGGLYTVRGYDESLQTGDSALVFNAEYRFHVPRVFGIEPEPRSLFGEPFRFAPQQVYGRPDWDLVLKGFFDYGKTWINDKRGFEEDFDLMSVGVGVDLSYKRNFTLRLDWGYVLEDVGPDSGKRAQAGDDRLHIVATFLY